MVSGVAELEARRYAVSLAHHFFRVKGGKIRVSDYRRALQEICLHIHRHLVKQGEGIGLDFLLMAAEPSRVYCARSGGGSLFLFHEGEGKAVLAPGEDDALLGLGEGEAVDTGEAPLQPGDMVVLCDPSAAAVMGERDITLILRRASDPAKAALFLSAIAERKGARSPFTTLVWEVPNYRGAAMLTGEEREVPQFTEERVAQGGEEEAPEAGGDTSHADQAKRQWLSKWRRRKG